LVLHLVDLMLLSLLLLIPFSGALGLLLWPTAQSSERIRIGAIVILAVQCVASFALLLPFDPTDAALQLVEQARWVHSIGLDYALAVDGLSLPLVLMNAVLCLVAAVASRSIDNRPRIYFALLLVISGAVNGAFLSQNLLLFFLFYELELIPLWLLIAVWGGANRSYAATKFLIVTAVSGMLILGAFLGLAFVTGTMDFSLRPILSGELGLKAQFLLMGALLIGFGIKIPLFPFHTWLPEVGNLWSAAFLLGFVPRGLAVGSPLAGCLGRHFSAVWLAGGHCPNRHETDGGLQLRWPHGIRPIGSSCGDSAGIDGCTVPDDQSRIDFRRVVSVGGCGVRPDGHAGSQCFAGPSQSRTGPTPDGISDDHRCDGERGYSWYGWFYLRIPDFPRQFATVPGGHPALDGGIWLNGCLFSVVGESRVLWPFGNFSRRSRQSTHPGSRCPA
jgi:hypothetical protein